MRVIVVMTARLCLMWFKNNHEIGECLFSFLVEYVCGINILRERKQYLLVLWSHSSH